MVPTYQVVHYIVIAGQIIVSLLAKAIQSITVNRLIKEIENGALSETQYRFRETCSILTAVDRVLGIAREEMSSKLKLRAANPSGY